MADVVIADCAVQLRRQVVLRFVLKLVFCRYIEGLAIDIIGQNAVVLGELSAETDNSGVVDRPAGRGRVQDKSKVGIGWLEFLPAIGEIAGRNAIYRIRA